jgi:hypothetical protein
MSRTLRAGIAPMVLAAAVFEIPGTVTTELTAGEWALYSRDVGGTQKVVHHDQVSIMGPTEVGTEDAFGLSSDATTIDVEGTTYRVFMRLHVPPTATTTTAGSLPRVAA